MKQYLFQYCQKLVVFSTDKHSILFAKRRGEAEFDEYWSLIGGKMEITDDDIISGIKREKDEEVGEAFRIKVAPMFSCYNVLYRKKSGVCMVLAHYPAIHTGGEVRLNPDEYSEHIWVPVGALGDFGPKVANTLFVAQNAQRLLARMHDEDFVEI